MMLSFVGRFLLLVVVTGVVEVYLLLGASRAIGLGLTAGLCVLTGVVGGALVRHQGLQTIEAIHRAFAAGRVPAREIGSGVVLLVVGVLLITPGFLTDAVGFALLIPALRLLAAGWLVASLERRATLATVQLGAVHEQHPRRGRVIDVQPDVPPRDAP